MDFIFYNILFFLGIVLVFLPIVSIAIALSISIIKEALDGK